MPKPKINETDLCRAAKRLGTSTAEVETVAEVESRGEAFYDDGFPVILFERHKFHRYTKGIFAKDHPHLSNPKAGGYGKPGQNQQNKFNEAFALDPTAAMKSCSWGRFQIMGFNYAMCGFPSVGAFVDAMKESEGRQLDAFVAFVITAGLADELRAHDWEGFAEGYNGENYKINKYDKKLAAAWNKFKTRKIHCGNGSAASSLVDQSTSGIQSSTSNPAGTETPPTNSETKVEVSAEGAVSVEKSEGTPAPKERIAVVKSQPAKWSSRVTTKITGVVTGNALFQWLWGQAEKIQGLEIHNAVWVIVSITIAVGSLLWIVHEIVDTWRANRNQERIDDLLVKENSTANNLVQLIPADELELYRARGFKIITRGEKV